MPEPLLDVRALDAFYGDFQALFGVSLRVAPGEVVAVIGANGAGKSTLLKCIAGAIKSRRDAILFDGQPIGDEPAHAVVARGIALVPEGRRLFPSLSVEENLLIGGQLGQAGAVERQTHLRALPRAGRAPAPAQHVALRRPAADGRHRPRADEQSQAPAVRRDQPGAGADRGARGLCPAALRRRRGLLARHRGAGHRAGAQGREPCLLPAGRPRRAHRRRRHADPRGDLRGVFRA